ncbi:MAG: hypothetical protein K2M36_01745, partial [Clostridia bacterium]|nr:hypothetical protein [Clostridia bacterium]
MKVMQRLKTPIVILMTALVILLSALVLFSITPTQSAQALASTASAYKAGNGQELYNNGTFNSDVVNDIREKIFGNEDPVSYIKDNGASDYNTYGKDSPNTAEKGTPYYVVPASTINAKVGNTTDGMVIKLGGREWMVTSLTLANTATGTDEVIATLCLADVNPTRSQFASANSSAKGSNMYSSSLLRKNLLSWEEFKLFSDGTKGGFASQYLVQPKYIQYQKTETVYGRSSWNNCPSDALGALSSGWNGSVNYQPGYSYSGSINAKYEDWGDDYIWIPSIAEMGASNITGTKSIWNLSANQQKHTSPSLWSWVRSGDYYRYQYGVLLGLNGQYDYGIIANTHAVRPAIHLNLTAIGFGTALKNPENVPATYNGDVQSIKSAYTDNPNALSWYDAKYYEHAGNYVKITPETELKNAGTHWVKVEITDAWINAVNAEVDADGAKYGWSATKIAETKASRKPKFKGDPVTEDGHVESDIVRWFKFIISPKELEVNKPSYNASTGELTAPSFVSGTTSGFSYVPALAMKFTGTAADGTVFDQIDEIPTKRGIYTAQAILVNSSTDKTEYSGGNFIIKNASSMTCSVQVNRARLAIPVSAEPSKPYTGSDVKFILPRSYDASW